MSTSTPSQPTGGQAGGGSPPPNPSATTSTETPALHPDRSQARAFLRLILIGAVIGIPAALVAAGFLALVNWVEDLLWTDLPRQLGLSAPPWYLVLTLPVIGAVIVALSRRYLPGDGGHPPLKGIGGAENLPITYGPGIALAALGTLAFGAVLGPEAPLIALGAVVGSVAVAGFRVQGPGATTLSMAGSFSAVSALFGGPLVAGMLLLEAGLAAGTALVPALLPGLTAAAVGYVLFVGFGSWGGLNATTLTVPDLPVYSGIHPGDLLLALVVGVLTSLVIGLVRRSATRLAAVATGSDRRMFGILVLGGLGVGVSALAVQLFGSDPQEVLFSGQSAVPSLLSEGSVGVLVAVLVAKAVGYAICLGCGYRGGPVFPAIFLGVGVAAIACLVFHSSISLALAVGTAAGMTAGTGLVFSALLFAALLGGTSVIDTMPAAVIAVVGAWLTSAALKGRAQQKPVDTGSAPAAAS